jgi:hypothetical protein
MHQASSTLPRFFDGEPPATMDLGNLETNCSQTQKFAGRIEACLLFKFAPCGGVGIFIVLDFASRQSSCTLIRICPQWTSGIYQENLRPILDAPEHHEIRALRRHNSLRMKDDKLVSVIKSSEVM